MGCGTSMHKGDTFGASQAVAEAEEAALARLREDNAELRRQNAQLTSQSQELSQRVNTLSVDVSGLRLELSQAAATASQALQAARTATERAEAAVLAAAAASQARPPTANGPIPIPIPAADVQILQRMQQVESQLSALEEKLESQRTREEFARQLRAAQVDRPPMPPVIQTPQFQPSNSVASFGGAGAVSGAFNAAGRLSSSTDFGNASGSFGNGGVAAAAAAATAAVSPSSGRPSSTTSSTQPSSPPLFIDGNGLLPPSNNFPIRFGGGALRASRDRNRTGASGGGGGSGGGGEDLLSQGFGFASTPGQTGPPPPADEFMSTVRYGSVLPSDLKLAEQRKQGPRQFL